MHLLLPLLASILFVCGLILVKRAGDAGASTITTLFFSNQATAIVFSVLWWFGGEPIDVNRMWQPVMVAILYLSGLTFTFLAISRGDVSIATPVFGVKVLLVAMLVTTIGHTPLPNSVWYAAVMATAGIGLIQWTGRGDPKRVLITIALAVSAAMSYATFDVSVQTFSPDWGFGRLLPILFWCVGLLSMALVPWVQWDRVRDPKIAKFLVPGVCLVAAQAVCIILTLAIFGDAARVNVVFALRGLWGVTLAWWVAHRFGGNEAHLSRGVLFTRLAGAVLLTAAVVLVIVLG
ncbi:hypothetical protein K227x_28460 [Rubripirellula lacrimiformis]|uniref:EamA domain-containing protein n=1 Tax=Rubripirellula lacrimiformis TaxID=1930273 RepID=A0A517NBE2_9BACT|nr:EamA/RhaT family transporter [Rubripirellula lacrimiformis]QDT04455.1 hypothetical protein K227x_28460 [Rubripirellula lacrimiformis]